MIENSNPNGKSRTKRLQWFRFSLASLLTFFTIGSVLLGLVVNNVQVARQDRLAQEEIERLGGYVRTIRAEPSRLVRKYFHALLGDAYFARIGEVELLHRDEEQLRALQRFSSVGNLRMAGSDFMNDDLRYLVGPEVYSLKLNGPKITDAGMQYVGTLKTLFRLTVSNSQVTDIGLGELQDLTQLTELSLCGAPLSGKGFAELAMADSLEVLDVEASGFNDDGLAALQKYDAITQLKWKDTEVTDRGMSHLAARTSVMSLDLSGTQITDRGLLHLARLKTLKLSGTQITDQGIANLVELQNLRNLILADTQITDVGAAELIQHRGLRIVNLMGTRVSGKALLSLASNATLSSIVIDRNVITANVVSEEMRNAYRTGRAVSPFTHNSYDVRHSRDDP